MAFKRGRAANSPNKTRTGARPPTRYHVFKRTLLGLSAVGPIVSAHDRESAIRQVAGDRRRHGGRFIAIPERMLREYNRHGKRAQ
jgi:hypothetical protein